MKIHFVGIGGIGMSALAKLALLRGDAATGSDMYLNNLTYELSRMGAVISEGHHADNLTDDTDLVVYSSCIKKTNLELAKAIDLGINTMPRTLYLNDLISCFDGSIGIIGTHGKTTTTSILAHIFEFAGKEPTIFVGGELPSIGSNAKNGKSEFFVTEIDESDGLFRNITINTAILTNLEREHVENFDSFENVIESYGQFISNVPSNGLVIYNKDDTLLEKIISSKGGSRKIGYSLVPTEDVEYYCDNLVYKDNVKFDLVKNGEVLGTVKAGLFGKHNAYNVLAASTAAIENGIDITEINETLKTFKLPKRRFEFIGEKNGIKIYEDYAHHPTEIKSILEAVRNNNSKGRVLAVFQPHRYSRTMDLLDEFKDCFITADIVLLTDIYSAFEITKKEVGIESIYNKISPEEGQVVKMISLEAVPDELGSSAKSDDLILVMGAGDVNKISKRILEAI